MLFVWTLVAAYIAATGQAAYEDPASKTCRAAINSCSASSLTSGRCGTAWNALKLDMIRLDFNNDCYTDGKDILFDLNNFYDISRDGKLCRDEWITRRTSYLGLTAEFVNYTWDNGLTWAGNMTVGKTCIQIADLEKVGSMDLKTNYTNSNLAALARFCSDQVQRAPPPNNNNRDCQSLVYVCREGRIMAEACQAVDSHSMSLYEKLVAAKAANDANGDGIIMPSEIDSLLKLQVDNNGDRCISLVEWRDRMTVAYQFSQEYANYDYGFYPDKDRNGCLDINDFGIGPRGIPADTYPQTLLGRIIDMCEASPPMYNYVSDCVQAADTCRVHYPWLPNCKVFINTCGLKKYSECMTGATTSPCKENGDKQVVSREKERVVNQINELCMPCNDGNTGARISVLATVMAAIFVCSLLLWS